ncbi:MAG: FAD-dependent oxidoreductase [Bacteroidota bacterium]|nr:FAD-dependent oxidoreductase [Bacteroidota bacterium]
MRAVKTWLISILLGFLIGSCNSKYYRADLIIYGGTSAGVAAAVEASRLGLSVIVVGPDIHLGGLSSSGLGWTDSGNKAVIGGFAREFYQRIKVEYEKPESWTFETQEECRFFKPDQDAVWVFEPHVAKNVFELLVEEYDIPVYRDKWLNREDGVLVKEGRIVSIKMLNGEIFKGKMFIDATYEGDLMAAAGVSYTTGREGNKKYNETLNGVNTKNDRYHNFDLPVDPYVIPGDRSSGLLPRIHDDGQGEEGKGDHRIQAYCFRMCLTQVPENRVPFPKPENYDPNQYELLARYLDAGFRNIYRKFDAIPNGKTDTNNYGGFSTDNIGMNYEYPDGSYEKRAAIIKEHEEYQKGLMWFLANDLRVPEDVRTEMSKWGLAKDEFLDNNHWAHQIYVREARRMVSDFVMTENHLRGKLPTHAPIGMGSYNMDSHHVQRYVDENGFARNEGDVEINPGGPYPISYRAIIPKKDEANNLLVPVCLSSSHIAYGSIRMEPVFMILGQSAANAAGLAIEGKIAIQDVDYEDLKTRLLSSGQVLRSSHN